MNLDFEGNSMEIPSGFNTPVTGLAIFHQSTLNDFLLDGLSLTVGLRLDHERISLDYDTGASVGYAFSMQMLPEALRSNVSSRLEGELSNHYTQLLPKFSLTYEWREGNNVYATVSKGYRSGGYNIQMFSDVARSALQTSVMNSVREQCYAAVDEHFPGQAEMIKGMIDKYMPTFSETDVRTTYYRPEYAWSYEVGSHLTLWQGKLQADLAAFWMDIRNQQIARMVASGMGRQMVNAGRSRSLGVEASLSATIDRHLETTLSYGFTRATFRDYDAGSSDGGDDGRLYGQHGSFRSPPYAQCRSCLHLLLEGRPSAPCDVSCQLCSSRSCLLERGQQHAARILWHMEWQCHVPSQPLRGRPLGT